MPRITAPDGTTKYIPGVYSDTRVVSGLPGPLPEFHVPIILGGADEGHPYNADTLKEDYEADFTAFKLRGTATACASYFGEASDVAVAFRRAARHGLPLAYCVCLGALTRASVEATSASGVTVEFTLYAKKFGAPSNNIQVAYAAGVLSITPVKHFALLTANAATSDTRIYVKDNSWVVVGSTIQIGDNNTANAGHVVAAVGTEIDSNGQRLYYVDLETGLAGPVTTALYAQIMVADDARVETSPTFGAGEGQLLIDWVNDNSDLLIATRAGTFTGTLPDTLTVDHLKDISGAWGTVTPGTSPAPTSGDYTAFVTYMNAGGFADFALTFGVLPQAYLVVDGSSTIHATMNAYALAERTRGFPISITAGCDWGDVSIGAGNDTDPTYRAGVLNSENFALVANGLDKLGSYISTAPAVFGLRIGGGLAHNLTNDQLQYEEVETRWDEIDSGELTSLTRAGVITPKLSTVAPIRYVVSQGLSTLQDNASSWNEGTNDTPLLMQRDLMDAIVRAMTDELEGKQVGSDRVTRNSVATTLVRRAAQIKKRGWIEDGVNPAYQINSITLNDSGAGWDVDHSFNLPVTADYITMVNNVLVGEV